MPDIQGWLNSQRPNNKIYHISKLKKNDMTLSIDAKKAFGKIQHPLRIKKKKILNKEVIEENFLNLIKN